MIFVVTKTGYGTLYDTAIEIGRVDAKTRAQALTKWVQSMLRRRAADRGKVYTLPHS